MKTQNQRYLEILKANRVSNTKQREIVFNQLFTSGHHPLSMQELIDKTIDKIDRASVYRTVEILEKIGILKRVHLGWKYTLELSDEFHGHHHHITCLDCGSVYATKDDKKLEEIVFEMAAKLGYKVIDHHIEIRARCSECQKL